MCFVGQYNHVLGFDQEIGYFLEMPFTPTWLQSI
jgi:hypothetical protein